MPVSALYVDTIKGPYPALIGVDRCWGVDRDARRFEGDGPIVAHPPCATWGKFWWRVKDRSAHNCGPIAVDQIRRLGGVLEHPVGSRLWKEAALPRPGEGLDLWGGFTVQVEQVRWGHPALKPTWLYVCGLVGDLPEIPPMREPSHCMVRRVKNAHSLPECPKRLRHITPAPFAAWLVETARRCIPTTTTTTTEKNP